MGLNGYEFVKERFNPEKELVEELDLLKSLRNKKRSIFVAACRGFFALLLIVTMIPVKLFNKVVKKIKNILG
jgi:hypothetical protein